MSSEVTSSTHGQCTDSTTNGPQDGLRLMTLSKRLAYDEAVYSLANGYGSDPAVSYYDGHRQTNGFVTSV